MKLNPKMLLTAAALLGLAACGKSADIAKKVVDGDVHTADAESSFSRGTWKTACQPTHLNVLDLGGEKVEYTVHSDSTLTRTTTWFEKNDCVTQAIKVEENGTFTNFNKTAEQMYTIDENFTKVEVTPLSQSAVSKMNLLVGYCNINTWNLNGKLDVTAKSGGTTCVGLTKTPRIDYDLLNITGDNNDQLFVGQADPAHDKSTAAARPVGVNRNVQYTH
jgi:hypothetical protein